MEKMKNLKLNVRFQYLRIQYTFQNNFSNKGIKIFVVSFLTIYQEQNIQFSKPCNKGQH